MDDLQKCITLKGTNDGYFLILDEFSSLNDIYSELETLLSKIKKDEEYNQEFNLTIDTGYRLLTDEIKEKLLKIIDEQSNFIVKNFSEKVINKQLADQWHKETSPLVIVNNVRNGQIVHSQRDIILLGNVRPGGIVKSTGNIIVIGDVQGALHAGINGDEDAVIIASFWNDCQVRIGEHVEILEKQDEKINLDDDSSKMINHQIVFLNDLHVIEFLEADKLSQIRPDFAKGLGGFEEWHKQL